MAEKIAVGILLALLRQFGAVEEDIPTMLAIARMESGLIDNTEGEENSNGTRDVGIWQINADEYWHDSEGTNDNSEGPDDFTRMWMEDNGGVLSFKEFRDRVQHDIQYSTKFAVDVVKYRENNPDSFPKGKFSAWSVYTDWIGPYINDGERLEPKNRKQDMDLAISYIEKFDSLKEEKYNPDQDKDVDYFLNSLVESVPQKEAELDIEEPEVEDTGEVIEVDSTPKHIDDRPEEEIDQAVKTTKSHVFLRNLDKITRFDEPNYIEEKYGVETPLQQVEKYSSSIEQAYQEYLDSLNNG